MPALIEEYIEGDEFTVSILGNTDDNIQVLPLSRTIFNQNQGRWNIYDYQTKQDNDILKHNLTIQRPLKNISKKLESLITELSLDVYRIMNCRDYGQIDIRVDEDDNPYILELNPNPSLVANSNFIETAKLLDMNYEDLLEAIILAVVSRYGHLR